MWAKWTAFYNRAKSADSALSLARWAWQAFLLVTGFSGAAVLAWMSTTWHWYWNTLSWAGVAIAFLISWIALATGFFLSGLAVRAWRNEKSNAPIPKSLAPKEDKGLVKNILIYTNSPDAPAMFGGIAAGAFDRVTLFLDYSAYYTALSSANWTQCRRIKLASFDPFEKGMRYEAIVVSRTVDTAR